MNRKRIFILSIVFLILLVGQGCIRRTNKEALHSYIVLDIGLQQQKENAEMKSAELFNSFVNQVLINPNNDTIRTIQNKAFDVAMGTKELCDYITKMKVDLVMYTDGVNEDKAKVAVEHPFTAKRKGDYKKTTIFFGTDYPPGDKGRAHELKVKIEDYKSFLLKYVELKDKDIMNKKLGILNLKNDQEHSTWEMFYFFHNPLSGALAELSRWQLIVRTAETDMLVYLYDTLQIANCNIQ